jgi:hypothetical protein
LEKKIALGDLAFSEKLQEFRMQISLAEFF